MRFKKSSGFSLVEVVIAVGIMSVMALSVGSMFEQHNTSLRSLREKLGVVDVNNALLRLVASRSTCDFLVTQPTALVFNATTVGSNTPPIIALEKVYSTASLSSAPLLQVGVAPSPPLPSLVVSAIQIEAISGVGDNYGAQLTVTFDPAKTVIALKKVSVTMNFATDPLSPLSAKRITSCGTVVGTNDLLWSGIRGGGGGRDYGSVTLNAGKRLSDYRSIIMLGNNSPFGTVANGGNAYLNIPYSVMRAKPGYMFESQTFSGDDSGAIGMKYISDTTVGWGTMRGGRIIELWGSKD